LRGSGQAAIATLQRYVDEAARDPAAIAIGTRVSAGTGSEAEWREDVRAWKIARCHAPDLG